MVLVDIYVPVMDSSYDFMLDGNVEISKIIEEIMGMLVKKTGRTNLDLQKDFELYSIDMEKVLEEKKTLCECGIKNGSKMILV